MDQLEITTPCANLDMVPEKSHPNAVIGKGLLQM